MILDRAFFEHAAATRQNPAVLVLLAETAALRVHERCRQRCALHGAAAVDDEPCRCRVWP